jgi:hypothetical protein
MSDKPKMMTPMKAIRAKCLDCSCGSAQEVRSYELEGCPLWPFRFGHRLGKTKPLGRGSEIAEKSATYLKRISGNWHRRPDDQL